MSGPIEFTIKSDFGDRQKVFVGRAEKVVPRAMGAVGLQLINNIVNGSTKEPVVPPVLTGLLRGSGSVFVGTKLISTLPPYNGQGTPSTQNSENSDENTITVGFNTRYAARMHERLEPAGPLKPGPYSRQSGDVGGKFIERHLKADGEELVRLFARILEKDLFT